MQLQNKIEIAEIKNKEVSPMKKRMTALQELGKTAAEVDDIYVHVYVDRTGKVRNKGK